MACQEGWLGRLVHCICRSECSIPYAIKLMAAEVFHQFGHIVGMGLITKQIGYGFGRPAYYLTDHQYQEFLKYAYGEWLQVSVKALKDHPSNH